MFLLIDKEKGYTSHDVVNILRKITGIKKIGHAGTLDPNATGLLIVAVGRDSTKKISEFVGMDKVYKAEIFLGEQRDTDDVEGKIVKKAKIDTKKPSMKKVEEVLKEFVGSQLQTPPNYSAIKIEGKKSYEKARKGVEFKLKPRQITIHSIELISFDYPKLDILCSVSSGTYIRSLARDVGKKLGTFGYLKNLRRVSIGRFDVKDALELKTLEKGNWKSHTVDI